MPFGSTRSVFLGNPASKSTYHISSSTNSANEGDTITFGITTTNVAAGTILYWTAEGSNLTAADFTNGVTSGTLVVDANGNGSISLTLTNDVSTEGVEDLVVRLRTKSTSGTIVASSDRIIINDTSRTPPTYNISEGAPSVNEGDSVTFTVTTTNFGSGTLYWTVEGAQSNDFAAASGTVGVTNDSGSILVSVSNDLTTEGAESFRVNLRTGSITGTIVANSGYVTINDTSRTPPTYTVVASAAAVNEGDNIGFTVTTTDFGSGVLYWTVDGAQSNDFGSTSGAVIIANDTGSFSVTAIADQLTEGAESFRVNLRTGSITGSIVANSGYVTINDTSRTPPTYSVSEGVSLVNEGSAVTFTVTTTDFGTGTLYWTVNGASSGDFVSVAGSVSVVNDSGTFSVTTIADLTTEGTENFFVELRTGSTSGTVVAISGVVAILDTSTTPPTYVVNPSVSPINEGDSVTFTVTTTNFGSGTLYWTIEGMSSADFVAASGSVSVTNNTGSFSVTVIADQLTEGAESFRINLRTGSTAGTVVANSGYVTINDTSVNPPAVYSALASVTSVNEGSAVTFTVNTSNVPNGTVLYWTNSGTTVAADFTGGANSGSVTINNNTASFSLTLANDATTEGSETIAVEIHTGSLSGPVVATAATVTVNDTSTNPPTYSVTPSTTSVNEGSAVTFTVNTTNVPDGTVLYWTNSGTTTASDFTSGVNSGSVTINSNTASFSLTLANDVTTEGSENIIISMRTTSTSGTVVATAATVTVNDTSTTPISYAIVPNVTSVNEGSTVTFTVNTTGVANGTVLYWTNSGTTVASDFTSGVNSGSVTINSGTANFSLTVSNDAVTEGSETIIINLRTGSTAGTIVSTANTVTVNDTSTTPAPTYSILPSVSTVSEGGTVTFTVNTTNVPNGTVLYWTNSGSTVASDFTSGANSGSFSINSNTGSFSLTLANDSLTEGTENIVINIRTSSTSGTIVTTSSTVTVSDTSTAAACGPYADQTVTGSLSGGTVWGSNPYTDDSDFNVAAVHAGLLAVGQTGVIKKTSAGILTNFPSSTQNGVTTTSWTSSWCGVTISLAPAATPTYAVTPSTTLVNEGGTVTFLVSTINVPNGTVLYWTNSGSTVASDFTSGVNSGSVTINNDTASFSLTLANDSVTEGSENIIVRIRTGSTSGTIVATSSTVLVNDTSTAPISYAVTPSTTSVNEGGTVTFTVNTTNVPNGTVLYWTNSGSTVASDFTSGANSGSFSINSNTGSFSLTLANDLTTEGSETIIVRIRTGSTSGTIVATSSTVTVNDTSVTPLPLSINYLMESDINTNQTSYSFSGISFGSNTTNKRVILFVAASIPNADATITPSSLGGSPMTLLVSQSTYNSSAARWIKTCIYITSNYITSSSGTVGVNFSSAPGNCQIATFEVLNLSTVSNFTSGKGGAVAEASTTYSVSTYASTPSIIAAMVYNDRSQAFTWSGITQAFDVNTHGGVDKCSGGYANATAAGSVNFSVTCGSNLRYYSQCWVRMSS